MSPKYKLSVTPFEITPHILLQDPFEFYSCSPMDPFLATVNGDLISIFY